MTFVKPETGRRWWPSRLESPEAEARSFEQPEIRIDPQDMASVARKKRENA
jgi:hypothetical protein